MDFLFYVFSREREQGTKAAALTKRRNTARESLRFNVRHAMIVRHNAQPPHPAPPSSVIQPAPINPLQPNERWMRAALQQAYQAYEQQEVPVGAVIVHEDRIIGEGYNQRESLNDPTAHAEMIAITQAAQVLESWRLIECTLYVTLEPCPMCAGAIVQARIPNVVYGTTDPKGGACHTLYQITDDARLNHRCTVVGGLLREECAGLLQDFFAEQRAKGKK